MRDRLSAARTKVIVADVLDETRQARRRVIRNNPACDHLSSKVLPASNDLPSPKVRADKAVSVPDRKGLVKADRCSKVDRDHLSISFRNPDRVSDLSRRSCRLDSRERRWLLLACPRAEDRCRHRTCSKEDLRHFRRVSSLSSSADREDLSSSRNDLSNRVPEHLDRRISGSSRGHNSIRCRMGVLPGSRAICRGCRWADLRRRVRLSQVLQCVSSSSSLQVWS